jgi:hypothetical protein
VPAIGMRLWAEERKSGTIELLLTLPVTAGEAVTAKFLAAWLFIGLALLLTFPIWITVNVLGDPDNGVILAGYLGSWLMAGGFLAISACLSALTRNQVVAFILSVVVCFGFLLSGLPLVLDLFRGWLPQAACRRDCQPEFPGAFQFHFPRRDRTPRSGLLRPGHRVLADRQPHRHRTEEGAVSMKNLYSTGALVLLAVLFVVLTMLGGLLFKNLRVDLTENKLYTLSDGTVNILESIDDPVTLRLYFSDTASEDLPQVRRYADRVWELMQEMETRADGQLDIVRIDPVPFSEQEDDAARYGLEAVPLSQAGDVLYLGVVGTNRIDGLEVLPFASPQRERFLEYDLARMITALATPDRSKVALISGLPITGGMDPATGQQMPSWAIHDQWNQLFDVRTVQPTATVAARTISMR